MKDWKQEPYSSTYHCEDPATAKGDSIPCGVGVSLPCLHSAEL